MCSLWCRYTHTSTLHGTADMPLIVLCGQPSSGKSRVVSLIEQQLQQHEKAVRVISEQTLHQERNLAYQDATSEKKLRGSLKATADRSLSKQTFVILDSLNAIKGYRYELWCIARAAGTKYCVVHCDVPTATAKEWNLARDSSTAYSENVFDDLASRFERPDAKNRWDKPLFTIKPQQGDLLAQTQPIISAMTDTANAGIVKSNQVSNDLTPTSATTNPALSATNLLNEVDRATQGIIGTIVDAQTVAAGGPAGSVLFGPGIEPLVLDQQVSVPELRRHKRAFMKLATQISSNRIQSAQDAKRMFVDYLQSNVQ